VVRYRARLEGGPRHGRKVALRAGPLGGPPDFVHGDEEGIYALAGAPRQDGTLPYWWMPWTRAALLRRIVPQTGDVPRVRAVGALARKGSQTVGSRGDRP
jgi:hypothetical protein